MDFFRTSDAERVALADPSYKQPNPQFVKRAAQNHRSDHDEFKSAFQAQPGRGAGAPSAARGVAPGGPGAGPQPLQGDPFEIVTAECDIVTIIPQALRAGPDRSGWRVLRRVFV